MKPSAIHNETQPHKYAASWTTSRTLGSNEGMHFYIAQYGLRIKQAANTLVIWRPRDMHGTSLPDRTPAAMQAGTMQAGLAFVTSNRLMTQWRRQRERMQDERDWALFMQELEETIDDDEESSGEDECERQLP